MKRLLVVLLALAFMPAPGWGAADGERAWTERLTLSGWLETVQSVRVRSPHESLTSRAKLRLELGADLGPVYGFFSMDAEKNWKLSSETGIDLHEAWLEHAGDGWDVRVGRQVIIWGKADGVQITDIVSPPDYTESVTRTLDEIRMPVDAVKFRLLGRWVDTELIWIPVFRAAVQPTGNNPWAVRQSLPGNVRVSSTSPAEPALTLENSEIALKVSAYLPGWDLAASVFHTWDDFPAMHREAWNDEDVLHVAYAPQHHRLTVFGLECSRPWSDFVFRSEAAYYLGRYFETTSILENPVRKNGFKWLTGMDWTPGNDWTLTAQLIGEHIFDHERRLAQSAATYLTTLNVSKKLLRQTLTLSNMLYYDVTGGDFFDQVKAEYAVTDALRLSVGADVFSGVRDGRYGRYRDNTQVWIRAKYSF